MRGKLRDKRATSTNKRDVLKRDVIERRRANRRENRLPTQLEQFDDDNVELDLELDEVQEENATPSKK
jgi:hypothetical protein